ncbi:MAG: acyltransferase family protein [Anaerostipes sp.]|nr:acyltransferase family protein [Anaerostipes sp.]
MGIQDKRLSNCSSIKAVMMLAVVLSHCTAFFADTGWFICHPNIQSALWEKITIWLGEFDIQTFAAISGYLFYYNKCEKNKYTNIKNDIYKRAKRIMLPYAIASIFWVIPLYIVFFKTNLIEIIKKYVLMTSPSQLWFLPMIFFEFILFYIFYNKIVNAPT